MPRALVAVGAVGQQAVAAETALATANGGTRPDLALVRVAPRSPLLARE